MANISDFKARMISGGARSNQFKVNVSFPAGIDTGSAGQNLQFLAKSATLPSSTLADVAVGYRGRTVHFAGEREFQPWTIEIYNDNDFNMRNVFERWVDMMQNAATTSGMMYPMGYQTQMQVWQLDRSERVVKEYNFVDAFPIDVGQIQLDWDQNNQIEIFPVTFQYNYWTSPTSSVVVPVPTTRTRIG